MIIDCGACEVAGTSACSDCVVAALTGENGILELVAAEQTAIETMSRVGLVPPIRLRRAEDAG